MKDTIFFFPHLRLCYPKIFTFPTLFQLLQNQCSCPCSPHVVYDLFIHFKIVKLLDPWIPFSSLLSLVHLTSSHISFLSTHTCREVFLAFRTHSHLSCHCSKTQVSMEGNRRPFLSSCNFQLKNLQGQRWLLDNESLLCQISLNPHAFLAHTTSYGKELHSFTHCS